MAFLCCSFLTCSFSCTGLEGEEEEIRVFSKTKKRHALITVLIYFDFLFFVCSAEVFCFGRTKNIRFGISKFVLCFGSFLHKSSYQEEKIRYLGR